MIIIDEFISLLESEKERVNEVLRPRVNPGILKYLIGGFFNDDQKRFIAYAIVKLDTSFYNECGYLFDYFEKDSHSAWLSDITSEKTRKHISTTSFQYKSTQECIEEGLYNNLVITFFGDFDFGEWNILRTYSFTDELNVKENYKRMLSGAKEPIKDWFFKGSIFQDTAKFFEQMNYPGREREIDISTNMIPYVGHSHLVAIVRNERKTEINHAFETYIKKAFFEPFAIKLKTYFPERYQEITSFWAAGCDMMYPNHKRFCLMITFAIDKNQVARLQCFIFKQPENVFYDWTYLPDEPYEDYGAYSEAIVDIFKLISKCDHMDYIREPECTLEDDDFWNNYVFKKENGEYLYLKEIKFID